MNTKLTRIRIRIGITCLLLTVASFCHAERTLQTILAEFDSTVVLLEQANAITLRDSDRFSDGKYDIYHFTVSKAFFAQHLESYWQSLSWLSSIDESEFSNCNAYRDTGPNNKIDTIRYGKEYGKEIQLGVKKQLFNVQGLHEASNFNRKHVFTIIWHKSGNKITGRLCHFVNTKKKQLKSIYSIPQNCGDFLILLSNFRAAFVAQDKTPNAYSDQLIIKTGIANKIVKLCQKYGYLLDEEERKRCSKAIYGICENVNDSFLSEMLTIAGNALEKGQFADK